MYPLDSDLIAAISTASGQGGIAIVRASGQGAEDVLNACFRRAGSATEWQSHRLYYGHVADQSGDPIDEGMAVLMRAPKSFTREDVFELHCHGGRVCAARALRRVIELGARPAEPGEFTKRAFLNGRIDLSEAEGVMALISSGGEAGARAALRQLEGGVSRMILDLSNRLTDLLALIEACDDFPEEMDEENVRGRIIGDLTEIVRRLQEAAGEKRAHILREGASVALIGRPNTGKSSLLNALVGGDRAIVTDVPGTTRDVLTERIAYNGLTIEISDTAGQRETLDPIEKIGVERAQKAVERADAVVLVLDGSYPLTAEDQSLLAKADDRYLICVNKSDLPRAFQPPEGAYLLSAKTGEGVSDLLRALGDVLGKIPESGDVITQERHLALAREAVDCLNRALETALSPSPLDLAAVELEEALQALLTITGQNASEQVIGKIFESFCVGK